MSTKICRLLIIGVVGLAGFSTSGCMQRPQPKMANFEPAYAKQFETDKFVPTGSIYRAGQSGSLVEDRRARRVGDVITIVLQEQTQASKSATLKTGRDGSFEFKLPDQAFPFSKLPNAFQQSATGKGLSGGLGSAKSAFDGSGTTSQSNQLSGFITATIAKFYPNGNMLLKGEKQMTINQGEEFIQISGIVRPEDIGPENTVFSSRIANAQIAYTGSGDIASSTKKGWFLKFVDWASPL